MLPELHKVSSDCIRDLLTDKITEKKSNAVCSQTTQILNAVKLQMQGFKTFGKTSDYNLTEVLYGSK